MDRGVFEILGQEPRVDGAIKRSKSGGGYGGDEYHVSCAKRGADYVTRGRTTRQNFDLPVPSSCCCCLLCQGKGDGGRHERGGRLSEAKTQRRPHSARERESERGGISIVVSLFLFLLAGQEKTPRGDDYEKMR